MKTHPPTTTIGNIKALLTLLALLYIVQASNAQTRDITKDTTEIRTFFKNPKIFSAEEMKEFDMLRNNNLKSPIGEFVLEYILMNFDIKSSDYKATVFTCILLDPNRNTSLGKWAYEEIKKDRMLKDVYNLMVKGIQTRIEIKGIEEEKNKVEEEKNKVEEEKNKVEEEGKQLDKEIKEKEAELKELQNLLKSLQEMRKAFEEFGNKKSQ